MPARLSAGMCPGLVPRHSMTDENKDDTNDKQQSSRLTVCEEQRIRLKKFLPMISLQLFRYVLILFRSSSQ